MLFIVWHVVDLGYTILTYTACEFVESEDDRSLYSYADSCQFRILCIAIFALNCFFPKKIINLNSDGVIVLALFLNVYFYSHYIYFIMISPI